MVPQLVLLVDGFFIVGFERVSSRFKWFYCWFMVILSGVFLVVLKGV